MFKKLLAQTKAKDAKDAKDEGEKAKGEEKPKEEPRKSSFSEMLASDAKWSLMPATDPDGKGSIMPPPKDLKWSLMPKDVKPSLMPGDGKPSLMPGDAKPSLMPGDAKPSLMPGDAKPSLAPDGDAKPSLAPGEGEVKFSLVPIGGKPSLVQPPGNVKSSLMTPKIGGKQSARFSTASTTSGSGHDRKSKKSLGDHIHELEEMQPKRSTFRQPLEFLIPKDKEAWLDYLVGLVRKKINIEYLNDKELRKVVTRARPNLGEKKIEIKFDPDAPLCLGWSVEEMSNWIESVGFPYLKEAFVINQISGRRLIQVDANALNRMGMSDLVEMRKVTAKIRDLLKIPAPNMLRALMRIPPFERFLQKKTHIGMETDALSFEKFCTKEGFIYSVLKAQNNKNAQIPCTCEVRILPVGVQDDDNDNINEGEDDDLSLLNAPSVEHVVRNMASRDATVAYIIELLLENVFLPNHLRDYGRLSETWKCGLSSELDKLCPNERLGFACSVARGLLEEMERTAEVLSDINLLQRYVKEEITQEHLEWLQACAAEFMENAVPIATLLAFGELDLETIFKQEPEFVEFVDNVVYDANETIKEMGRPGLEVDDGEMVDNDVAVLWTSDSPDEYQEQQAQDAYSDPTPDDGFYGNF